ALALVAASASSAQVDAPVPAAPPTATTLPVPDDVAAFYSAYTVPQIWFRGGVDNPATSHLIAILRRAPFDGFAAGPQLADQVQAAVAQAHSGNAADMAAAERTLSTAWVQYVQAIRKPTSGMIYAYPFLQPQGRRADQILLTAAGVPSLESYISSVANVNPIYSQL